MKTKEEAIDRMLKQIELINILKMKSISSPEFEQWHLRTTSLICNIFGENSRQINTFSKISFFNHQISSKTLSSTIRGKYREGLNGAENLLKSFIDEVEDFGDDRFPIKSSNDILVIEKLCHRFHLVTKQLKLRYKNRETLLVNDEYDVQNLFHALLLIEFDDVYPEEWIPSYAGSTSRVDFFLKKENIFIEIKKTRDHIADKQIGDQLIIDIDHYRNHPGCHTLLCFVYDPEGKIKIPRGIENDLNITREGLIVKVIIAP